MSVELSGKTGFKEYYSEIVDTIEQRDRMLQETRAICGLVDLRPGSSVLDIPCGNGRYTVAFHQLGHRAVGVDLSEELIAYAGAHNPGPDYLVGDMRNPPEGRFDLIVNLFSSFGVCNSEDEDVRVLDAWFSRLAPGGSLILDTTDLERTIDLVGTTGQTTVQEFGDCRRSFQLDMGSYIRTATFELDGVGSFTHRMRLYEKEHLAELLRGAGLCDVMVYGSYKKAPKQPSDRAIFVARRGT